METIKKQIMDIPDNSEMRQEAIQQAKWALENVKIESLVSKHIKIFFDKKYGPNWHCVVGIIIRKKLSYLSQLSKQKFFVFL